MPLYTYKCHRCKTKIEKITPMLQAKAIIKCPKCRFNAVRDFAADRVGAKTDSDFTSWDVDRYQELKNANKPVHRPVLSQSLGLVPGLNKIKGRDGRQYATFRNEADRNKTLKRLGLADGDT